MRLIIRDIKKKFDEITVLNRAGYDFESGIVYGIAGARGSGRTTLLKCICTECVPDSGYVCLDTGIDIRKADYMDFGIVYDKPVLPEMLTGNQYIRYMLRLHEAGAEDTAEYFRLAGISDELMDEYIGNYSDDEKQRLQFAGIMITSPAVILIDEPKSGGRNNEMLKALVDRMKRTHIIIITSDEGELPDGLVDELVMLKGGVLSGSRLQERQHA